MYTHGGKRKNSGRKPVSDPVKQVTVYPLTSEVDLIGGVDAAKAIAAKAIKARAKKLKDS